MPEKPGVRHAALKRAASPRRRAHHGIRGRETELHSTGSDSIVSNGADVPPPSPLNPDYDYALPPHLALFAQPPSSIVSTEDTKPGSTIVFAPYTVTSAQRASTSTPSSSSGNRDARSIMHGHSDIARSAGDGKGDGVGETSRHSTNQGSFQHSPELRMRVHGEIELATQESRQLECGSSLVATSGEDVDDRRGTPSKIRRDGLAQAADVTQQTTDVNTAAVARRLQRQLDSFAASDLFLGRFEMLGRRHRRRGGATRIGTPGTI